MKKIRLLIVDDNPTFSRRAKEYLSGTQEIEVVGCANDGSEASGMIIREQPDAVVMDFVLRRISSLSLLRAIHESVPRPAIIVCSAFLSDATIGIARRFGVDFFIGKPVPFPHLHECIVDVVSVKHHLAEEERYVEDMNTPVSTTAAVRRALISSGISPRLSGFSFLSEAVQLLLSDQSLLKSLSHRLYPRIAQAMNTSPGNVERNIRSAIQRSVRGSGIDSPPPTNRNFITALFGQVLEEQQKSSLQIDILSHTGGA